MKPDKIILLLSFPLVALIILASCTGLFTPDFYSNETINWKVQSIGQDMINLFLIVPFLFITSIGAYKRNRNATMMWGGVTLYLAYTFTLYCFDVHFNRLFVVYCLCLGLSYYSLMYFLHINFIQAKRFRFEKIILIRITGIYLIILSVLFYLLWLSEIVPSLLKNTIPKSITETGLFTNGVHVLDLAIILPGIFITGFFLMKKNVIGFVLAPVFLTFFILMDITICVLILMMKTNGLEAEILVAVVMGVLAVASAILLHTYLKELKIM